MATEPTLTALPEEPSADAPATVRLGEFFVVCAVLAVTTSGFYFTTTALPLYFRDLGATQGRIGAEVVAAGAVALLVTLGLGPAINRLGPRFFLTVGALLSVIAPLGMLAFPTEASVTFFRGLQGAGIACLLPSAYTLGAELVPKRPGTALGVLGAIMNLSLAFGPPFGFAIYVSRGSTWLFVPALIGPLLAFLASFFIRSGRRPEHTARGFGFNRVWLPLLMTNCLLAVYFGGLLAYLPLHLRSLHGPNPGIFFTADGLGVLLMRVPTGMLVDRGGTLLPKLLGLTLTLPGIGLLAFTPSVPVLLVAGAATGVGAGLFVTGVLVDFSGLSSRENRGTAMSMFSASASAGLFLGAGLSGAIIGPAGFNGVLAFGAITCLAAFPFAAGWWPGWNQARGALLASRRF